MCTSCAYELREQMARAARSKLCKVQIVFKTNIRRHVSLCLDIQSIREDRPTHANRFKTFCTLQTGSSSPSALKQWRTVLFRLASVLP